MDLIGVLDIIESQTTRCATNLVSESANIKASYTSFILSCTAIFRSWKMFYKCYLVLFSLVFLLDICASTSPLSFLPLKFFSPAEKPLKIKFFPDDGMKNRKEFESMYGTHGEHLIFMLGRGLVPGTSVFHNELQKERDTYASTLADATSTVKESGLQN